MIFEGDKSVIAVIKEKKRLMEEGEPHEHLRPLLFIDGGLMKGAYGIGASLALEELGLDHVFSYVVPNGAYYIFLKMNEEFLLSKFDLDKDSLSLSFAYKMIEDIQVSLVPGAAFGANGEGYVRLSFGKGEDEINEAFDRIDSYLKK